MKIAEDGNHAAEIERKVAPPKSQRVNWCPIGTHSDVVHVYTKIWDTWPWVSEIVPGKYLQIYLYGRGRKMVKW